ncbi:uncharacterized protein LOC121732201 [Aricia agestis]|uniref:uncharacterized protein LOC121732201 n=1 Tax=Aricia agestis TaxID=91739 RepID=UPI001C202F68|nr:uncharacterized protein LOC121732201 [Aricia agestis]
MTVITKSNLSAKKLDIVRVPLGDEQNYDEDKVEVQEFIGARQASKAFVCLSFGFMMLILSLTTGLLLYRQYRPLNRVHRFTGYCTVAYPVSFKEEPMVGSFRVVPIHSENNFQIVSTLNDNQQNDDLENSLHEELDIEDSVEKIEVYDNGHSVNFIHDFNANQTGIVDADRCFVMDLEPDVVLGPSVFAAGLTRGDEFDVSRVRSSLRAVLPVIQSLFSASVTAACETRPIYRLVREEETLIRKRSAEDPPHDFIHFSGKHVQEIKIQNLEEILNYENQNKTV